MKNEVQELNQTELELCEGGKAPGGLGGGPGVIGGAIQGSFLGFGNK